jgi:hypothetical protein
MDYEIVDFLKDAIGFVEANDFEVHSLWLYNKELVQEPLSWIENSSGRFVEIGSFGGKPVCLSLRSAVVDGQKVIFYEAVSLVVHHDIVKGWITKWAPKSARFEGLVNKTDAANFHNIFRKRP